MDERRREPRIWVPGIAVLQSGEQPPSVWRVSNLSSGGVALVGDGTVYQGRVSLTLHVAGFEALELTATVLRRQLARSGRCGVRFADLRDQQRQALSEIMSAAHLQASVRRRALVVIPNEARAPSLSAELAAIGFAVRRETSPGQAAAWLQKESAEVLLVDDSVVEADRWSLLEFARDTAPEIRRLVVAQDVRGFRLYYAIKAGWVEGLIEPTMIGDALARHLLVTASPRRQAV